MYTDTDIQAAIEIDTDRSYRNWISGIMYRTRGDSLPMGVCMLLCEPNTAAPPRPQHLRSPPETCQLPRALSSFPEGFRQMAVQRCGPPRIRECRMMCATLGRIGLGQLCWHLSVGWCKLESSHQRRPATDSNSGLGEQV